MSRGGRARRRQPGFETRILLHALLIGLPGTVLALLLLWTGDFTDRTRWTLGLLAVATWLGFAFLLRERVIRPLQTLSNLLGALREGDFSIRARGARSDDALGLGLLEVNALGETLREQRLGAHEASALLDKIMMEIDVAVYAFDGHGCLRLANRAGLRLLGERAVGAHGRRAEALGLEQFLEGDSHRTEELALSEGGGGRWELRRTRFRLGGLPHQLVVLTDLSRALREEERLAWQRLIRVIGHEINNSLAPIQSIAGSLRTLIDRTPRPDDWEQDVAGGLHVIAARSEALARFMAAYARLAKLPRPRRGAVPVAAWVRGAADLEVRLPVEVVAGPDITVEGDADQLEQALINLIRNAADASLETGGAVAVRWRPVEDAVEVCVEDEGPGIDETANLFVPFFTTRPGGSGIGLALSRQIAEAHGGTLQLENRGDGAGARARLRIPIRWHAPTRGG